MKIADSHCHLVHNHKGFREFVESGVIDHFFLMDLSGVEFTNIQMATQAEILEVARDYPENITPYGFLQLDEDTPDSIEHLKEIGFKGLKPYKPREPYSAEKYYPLYAKAQELGMPILFHTGLVAKGPGFNPEEPVRHGYGPSNMRPSFLSDIAEAFPKLLLINGHAGYPWYDETESGLYYYKNIVGDVSGYIRDMERLKVLLDRKCNDGSERYFIDKIAFASDSFYGIESEIAHTTHLLELYQRYFEFVGGYYHHWGTPENTQKFFYDNAMARLTPLL